jgi:hypothetical protein
MKYSTECLPHDVPDGLVMPAADCMADFDTVCSRIGARPTVRYVTYSKKLKKPRERYRCVGLKLTNGRFATLLKEDKEKYFEIWLQRKGYGYYLSEVEEVRCFITVEKSDILRLDNTLKWIQPSEAESIDLPIMTMKIVESEPWKSVLNRGGA